jgi:hypothetical protein
MHLEVPDHCRRYGHDDEIHKDAQAATRHDEVQALDTLAALDKRAVRTRGIHQWSEVCVTDRGALEDIHNARRESISDIHPDCSSTRQYSPHTLERCD